MRLVQHESTIIKKSKQKKTTEKTIEMKKATTITKPKRTIPIKVYYCSTFNETGSTPDNENLNHMVKLI